MSKYDTLVVVLFATVVMLFGANIASNAYISEGPDMIEISLPEMGITGASIIDTAQESAAILLNTGLVAAIFAMLIIVGIASRQKLKNRPARTTVKVTNSEKESAQRLFQSSKKFEARVNKELSDIDATIARLSKALK